MKRTNVINLMDKDWWKEERKPSDQIVYVKRKRGLADKYYTVKQAAEKLSISIDVIYDAIAKREIESQRIGKRGHRISEEALLQYLDFCNLRHRA